VGKTTIEAAVDTVHWGYLSGAIKPVVTVRSGDTVAMQAVSGPPEIVAESPFPAAPALLEIHQKAKKRRVPGHFCTGPVGVEGAQPGHVLQVDILAIDLDSDWGYAAVKPLHGALPNDFDKRHVTYVAIDRKRSMAHLPWDMDLPLKPFFGVICTAPPRDWGELSTQPPRRNGGNLDNRELVPGTTLFLPVFVEEALFSVGDGHAAQGDGEICSQALETDMRGEFRLTLRKDMSLTWPVAETPTHIITMGCDPDIDDCVVIATRNMIDLLVLHCGLNRTEAYTLLSFAGELRITQACNPARGVHLMLDKKFFRNKTLRVD
jgi:acetamidase/formamidase